MRPVAAAIVIGLDTITGLQTARLLAARGITVVGIAGNPRHHCARTKACEVIGADTTSDALVDTLLGLRARFREAPVLFPCTDLSVRVLTHGHQRLASHYRIGLPTPDTVDMLMDKAAFSEFAAAQGVPIPPTVVVRDPADAERAAHLDFPCVAKPALRDPRWDAQAPGKVLELPDVETWRAVYPDTRSWADTLVVQSWVPGAESELFSCNCYFTADGRPLVTFVARKIRQWPPEHGTSCLGEEVRNDTVLDATVALFRAARFHGLGYVEMKRDARSGELVVIEANVGRPTGRSAIAEAGGVELLRAAYCDLAGLPLPTNLQQRYGHAKWVYLRRDAQAAYRRWRQGQLSLREWAQSWRGLRHDAVFSVRDQRPFWGDIVRAAVRRRPGLVHVLLPTLVASLLVPMAAKPAGSATQVGYAGHVYDDWDPESAGGAITGHKPESKLWFHDGAWWGAMVSAAAGGAHTIHKLVGTTWTDTSVMIDSHPTTKEDVLSDGDTLYILSRGNSVAGRSRLRRYQYVRGPSFTGYVLDAGFPVDLPGRRGETKTLAKDSTGRLWITFEAASTVFVAHSLDSDTVWSRPFALPVSGASTTSDDISAVIAFSDDAGPAVGIMWSNQNTNTDYFAVHRDGDPAQAWTVETALAGPLQADDHLNLKTYNGHVYAAVKTAATAAADPSIKLLVRAPDGRWRQYPVSRVDERQTKPVVVLDIASERILVFSASLSSTKRISYKESPLAGIGFAGSARVLIRGPANERVGFPTTSKDNATADSGILVLASDRKRYWFNGHGVTLSGQSSLPAAIKVTARVRENRPAAIRLRGADAGRCELTFQASVPAAGALTDPSPRRCRRGTPHTDTAVVHYTPPTGFVGLDRFTVKVGNGRATAAATVTVQVRPAPERLTRTGVASARSATRGLTIPAPGATTDDDILIASVSLRGRPRITPPRGWSVIRRDRSGTALKQVVYARIAGSTEPASYRWRFPRKSASVGGIVGYSGGDVTNPVVTSSGAGRATSRRIIAPRVAARGGGSVVIGAFSTATATTVVAPVGSRSRWTRRAALGRSRITSMGAARLISAPGDTAGRTAVAAKAARNIAQLVVLRAAR